MIFSFKKPSFVFLQKKGTATILMMRKKFATQYGKNYGKQGRSRSCRKNYGTNAADAAQN